MTSSPDRMFFAPTMSACSKYPHSSHWNTSRLIRFFPREIKGYGCQKEAESESRMSDGSDKSRVHRPAFVLGRLIRLKHTIFSLSSALMNRSV
jgi:hypothetical protein